MTPATRRARLSGLLALALGALALIALPGSAAAKHGRDHSRGMQNGGTVASFDEETGALTIDLREGGTVTALVGDETRILCVGPLGRRHGHGRQQRRNLRRHRGAHCTTDALAAGAIVKKARIETVEEDEVFERILIAGSGPEGTAQEAGAPREGHRCDHHHADDEGGEERGEEPSEEGGEEGQTAS